MCGICGEIRFDPGDRVSRPIQAAMREALAHRGPDAAGLYVSPDGAAALAFRRLSVIDLSAHANQPFVNEDGTIQLVCNGEIYNFRRLRAGLEGRGHRFRSRSDSEVALHLYEEKGLDAIADLEGMFALAIWDNRNRRLVLARDRAGKKPLFYHRADVGLVFASEIKAFFGHPQVPLELDPSTLPAFFLHGYVPGPGTLYRGIQQVEPGTIMAVEGGGTIRTQRYWRLRSAPLAGREPAPSRQEACETLRGLVTSAVERRLTSDVPVGVFLSGGVDSTIVTGVMRRLLDAPVRTFSIGFENDRQYDETRYGRIAAEHFQTDHTEFHVRPSDIDLIQTLIWHHDGPFGDASAIPTYVVARLARQHVTVVLTGDGGDELFAGYQRFAGTLLTERIPALARRLVAAAFRQLPPGPNEAHWLSLGHRVASKLRAPMYERLTSWISVFFDDLEALFAPDFLGAVAPIDRLAYLRARLADLDRLSPLSRLLEPTFHSYLCDDVLVKVDRCTMAHGLEARCPFLDREVVDYAAMLPDDMKLRGRRTKLILKEAFTDLLPPEIAARGKMGFAVPLTAWFRGSLGDFVADALLASDARYVSYLSRDFVRSLVLRHRAGEENVGLQLWTVLCFEIWLRLLPGWQQARNASLMPATEPGVA
jgi:asparagine synthase (glutamine-hydrolysing)